MDNYEATTRIITILNHIAIVRNFINPRKNLFNFLCSWIWNMSFITIVVCEFSAQIYILTKIMPFSIESITYMFQSANHVFGYMTVAIIGLYQSKNALTLVKQINQVDENLKNLGIKVDYRDLFRHVKIIGYVWLLNAVICGIFFIQIMRNRSIVLVIMIINYYFITNASSVILYDYNTTIYWLGLRFKMINGLLETFLSEDDQLKSEESSEEIIFKPSNNFRNRLQIDNCSSSRSLQVSETLPTNDSSKFKKGLSIDEKIDLFQQIRILHLQVCNVSKMVNHIFNAQILIYTITWLTQFSISIYTLYMDTRRGITSHKRNSILTVIISNICGFLKIALASYDCEYTMRQADKTISLVHACSLYRESAELKNETLQFVWQISYTQLEDTKSVHYIVNYNFVRDCFYFVLTYLVIMVQLSQNLTTKDLAFKTNETI